MRSLFLCSLGLLAFIVSTGCDRASPTQPQYLPDKPKKVPVKTDVDSILAEVRREKRLDSGEEYEAVALVRKHIPTDHPRRSEVFKTLLEIGYGKKDLGGKTLIVKAAVPYAAREDIPAILEIPKHGPFIETIEYPILRQLAELKDPSCAEEVAKGLQFGDQHGLPHRLDYARTLRALGPAAEKAVRPYALPLQPSGQKHEPETRQRAIEVLADIGNEETITFLDGLEAGVSSIKSAIDAAIKKLSERKKQNYSSYFLPKTMFQGRS
jgi:hypothetical protein